MHTNGCLIGAPFWLGTREKRGPGRGPMQASHNTRSVNAFRRRKDSGKADSSLGSRSAGS